MSQASTPPLIPSLEQWPLRSKTLENAEAIALIHNDKYRRLLRHFMQQPSSIAAAAAATGQSVQRTYNHVQRLLELDLVVIEHTEARRGKPIKYYRATADDYFMPFARTQALDYGDMIEQELRPLQGQMLRAFERHLAGRNPDEWGTRLFRDPSGFIHLSFTPKDNWQHFDYLLDLLLPAAPALVNFWGKMQLTNTQAKSLQLELMQLWSKYYFAAHSATEPSQLETFAVGLSLVPLED
jgi:hypothetical protein